MSTPSSFLYPSPPATSLKLQYIGQQIKDVQAPAAILDVAVVRRNCALMLATAEKLGVGFRAHVKTHKTTELSQYQVGETSPSLKFVASTVAEVEGLAPWLYECKKSGKKINILYGLPVSPSALQRLATVARLLGEGSVGLFVDHPAHIALLAGVTEDVWPGKIPVFVLIDVGSHREGVAAGSRQLADVATALAAGKNLTLTGLYTHMGHSYAVSSPEEALQFMVEELGGLEEGARSFLKSSGIDAQGREDGGARNKVVLSLGATPTATSIQNLLADSQGAKRYRDAINQINQSFAVEFHAGVYPVMDMQQLATRARPLHSPTHPHQSLLSFDDLGFRILVEVASVYPDRGEKPEALIAAGGIVFGREACKSYPGHGVVTPWPARCGPVYDPEGSRTGWIVSRISQEHGNLTWEGARDQFREMHLGDKLLVWPNHACIAGVNFGWYLVVDSESSDPDTVCDVWIRWRGW